MTEGYEPTNYYQALAHIIEEAGEVISAYGKSHRFGSSSRHPNGGETNEEWLLNEIDDLDLAIRRLREFSD